MAIALFKNLNNPNIIRKTAEIFCIASRNHWNYQYKPGPYPRTAKERYAAAKKYNLSPEEYQTYPEEMGYGDYPKLPAVGADSRDNFYPYDIPALKRNFNEPYHINTEIFGEDRCDVSMRPRFPVTTQLAAFLGTMMVAFAVYFYLEEYKFGRPVVAKQYPKDGPHYLFSD